MKDKLRTKKYWTIVAIIFIANIFIFSSFSRRLEIFIINSTFDGQENNGSQ